MVNAFPFMKKISKKRAERSFSYSPPSSDLKKPKMAATSMSKEHEVGKEHSGSLDDVLKQIFDSIQFLGDRLENKIEQLQTDMDCFRHEVKEDLSSLKATISGIERSLEQAWEHIEDHTAELKAHKDVKDSQQKEIDELKSELQKTTLLLNTEKENNITLENYTRRENLKFMNLPEDRGEDCKGMIINLIQNDLKIDVTHVRFHAVHRVGKPAVGKTRPIIARFVCREDRDLVWSRKKDLKNSTTYQDAYITQDYAKAIQQERRTLIKAMKKARTLGFNSKVIDRHLFVNEERFTSGTIPEQLKESPMETEIIQ